LTVNTPIKKETQKYAMTQTAGFNIHRALCFLNVL